MSRKRSRFGFRLRSVFYWFRDLFNPPDKFLGEAGLRENDVVLDYGCGSGNYTFPASRMARDEGVVYALDIDDIAIEEVERKVEKKGYDNIQTIQSDCDTNLPDGEVDVILLYDVYHHLEEPEHVLSELRRVLRPDGVLSFSDHHLSRDEIICEMEKHNWKLEGEGENTYTFVKV